MVFSFLPIALIVFLLWNKFSDNKLEKPQVIAKIVRKMRENNISLDEIKQAIANNSDLIKPHISNSSSDVAMKIFSWLGGIFIFAGVGFYIGTFWNGMSSSMRIFITLGTGIFLSILSIIAMKEGKYPKLVLPLIFIAASIETSGWFVMIDELFPHGGNMYKATSAVFAIMALQQSLTYYFFKTSGLAFISIFFLYAFFDQWLEFINLDEKYISLLLGFCLTYTAFIISKTSHRYLSTIIYLCGITWFNAGVFSYIEDLSNAKYAAIFTGMSIMSAGYSLKNSPSSELSGLGLLLGSALFYSGLFDLIRHSSFELIYFAICFSGLYFCILLASRALLTTTIIALLGFLGYYSNEHFVNSLGWAISLIILGVAFFAISALALNIKTKYMKNR